MVDIVLVACKLSNGLILRLMRKMETTEPVLGGGVRSVVKYEPTGETVELKGPAVPPNTMMMPNKMLYAGYGVTPVPRAFWELWLEQNKDSTLLESRTVFAAKSEDRLRDQVDDQNDEGLVCGLEPLDPTTDANGRPSDKRLQSADMRRGKLRITVADEQKIIPRRTEEIDTFTTRTKTTTSGKGRVRRGRPSSEEANT